MDEKLEGVDWNLTNVLSGPFVISSSYGNDSIAMIQYAYEHELPDVTVVYIDSLWSSPGWGGRVGKGEELAKRYGFHVVQIKSIGFEALVRERKGFPWSAKQFCTMHLKGIPFLEWIDVFDKDRTAVVMIGKRRAESVARRQTPEYIQKSEYHGDRLVWNPLFNYTDEERDVLVFRSGMKLLDHRSQDCSPCVNANRKDFLMLTKAQIERVNKLEVEIGRPMFRPKRYGVVGIYGVMVWAKYGHDRSFVDDVLEDEGCGAPFGCRC